MDFVFYMMAMGVACHYLGCLGWLHYKKYRPVAVLRERLGKVEDYTMIVVEHTEPWMHWGMWPTKRKCERTYLYKCLGGDNFEFLSYPEVEPVKTPSLWTMMSDYERGVGSYNQNHMRLRKAVDSELGLPVQHSTLLKDVSELKVVNVGQTYTYPYDKNRLVPYGKTPHVAARSALDIFPTQDDYMLRGTGSRHTVFNGPSGVSTLDEVRASQGLEPLSKAAQQQVAIRNERNARRAKLKYRVASGQLTPDPNSLAYVDIETGELVSQEAVEDLDHATRAIARAL